MVAQHAKVTARIMAYPSRESCDFRRVHTVALFALGKASPSSDVKWVFSRGKRPATFALCGLPARGNKAGGGFDYRPAQLERLSGPRFPSARAPGPSEA
jgi:hypothetical protein